MLTFSIFSIVSTAYAQEWYNGGTLHKADGNEWYAASYANKLATAGDFSAVYIGIDNLSSMDELKAYAINLVTCLDEFYGGVGVAERSANPAAQSSALCMVLMGYPQK